MITNFLMQLKKGKLLEKLTKKGTTPKMNFYPISHRKLIKECFLSSIHGSLSQKMHFLKGVTYDQIFHKHSTWYEG